MIAPLSRAAAGLGADRMLGAFAEEDREVWAVAGDPTGEALALVRAAVEAVDQLQAKIRAHLEALGS
jgi:hypothetical protein